MSAAHLCSGHWPALRQFRGGGADRRHGQSKPRCKISAIAAPEKEAEVFNVPNTNVEVPKGLNKFSGKVTQPKSQGASQAMLYATGLTESDMDKPQVICRNYCDFLPGSEHRISTDIVITTCYLYRLLASAQLLVTMPQNS